jgi:maltooligosyltrehalose trehalohydrolase
VDGAVLGTSAFVLRFFGGVDDRLLVINLGSDLDFTPAGEPLLAPGAAGEWQLAWTSEAVEYGGHGVHPLDMTGPLTFPGNCALFFEPRPSSLEPRTLNLEP